MLLFLLLIFAILSFVLLVHSSHQILIIGFSNYKLLLVQEVLQGLERLLVQCCVTTTVEQLQQQRFLNSGEWLGIHLSQVNIMRLAVHIQEETRAVKMREETMKG